MAATPDDCPGLDDCAQAAPIHEQLERLQAGLQAVAAGHVELADGQRLLTAGQKQHTEQIAEVALTLKRHDDQLRDLGRLPAAVAENTTVTRDVLAAVAETRDMVQAARDLQAAGRLGARILRWARSGIVWAAAMAGGIVAIVAAIKTGHKP